MQILGWSSHAVSHGAWHAHRYASPGLGNTRCREMQENLVDCIYTRPTDVLDTGLTSINRRPLRTSHSSLILRVAREGQDATNAYQAVSKHC